VYLFAHKQLFSVIYFGCLRILQFAIYEPGISPDYRRNGKKPSGTDPEAKMSEVIQ